MLAGFFHIFVRCNDPPMKNIRFGLCIPAFLFALFCSQQASPQGYVKLAIVMPKRFAPVPTKIAAMTNADNKQD